MANRNEPLGLPDGSIRALLAFGIISVSFALFAFTSKLGLEGLLSLVNLPMALYFGQYMTPPGTSAATVVHAVAAPVSEVVAPVVETLAGVAGAAEGAIQDLTGGLP